MKKSKCSTKPVLPLFADHGWNENGSLTWTSEIFLEEVEEILLNDEFDTIGYIDDSGESDDEEDIRLSPVLFGFKCIVNLNILHYS